MFALSHEVLSKGNQIVLVWTTKSVRIYWHPYWARGELGAVQCEVYITCVPLYQQFRWAGTESLWTEVTATGNGSEFHRGTRGRRIDFLMTIPGASTDEHVLQQSARALNVEGCASL